MKATAPELPAKIKAQQMAGNVMTTMVLTGYDAMAAGLKWEFGKIYILHTIHTFQTWKIVTFLCKRSF